MATATSTSNAPWNPLTDPVDRVQLAGVWAPGLSRPVGASSPRKWDEQDGPGWSGGLLIYRGIKLCHFSVWIYLYTDEDWRDWDAFRPLVMRPPRGQRPRTYPIWHPLLAQMNISACVVEDVRAPDQVEPGVWLIDVSMIESRIPKKGKPIRPEGADAVEDDWREREIERRTKLRDQLAAEGEQL